MKAILFAPLLILTLSCSSSDKEEPSYTFAEYGKYLDGVSAPVVSIRDGETYIDEFWIEWEPNGYDEDGNIPMICFICDGNEVYIVDGLSGSLDNIIFNTRTDYSSKGNYPIGWDATEQVKG